VQRIKGENEMKTSELTGAALDWAVCEATGMFKAYTQFRSGKNFLKVYGVARNKHLHPSTDWAQGGPIIEREGIDICTSTRGGWIATLITELEEDVVVRGEGDTCLIAAMRCCVASKLGDEVEIPKELA
jgi:hypothetical protein